jgi:hypothetical protein
LRAMIPSQSKSMPKNTMNEMRNLNGMVITQLYQILFILKAVH